MFREIRGVEQRRKSELRRWFQDRYFDLFFTQDGAGDIQWFQLCYARDTRRERVLEWRRGRGFQHLKVRDRYDPISKDSNALVFDGVLPYADVIGEFTASAPGLPPEVGRLVAEKVNEYARPARRFRRMGTRTPRWIERMREREKTDARLRGLEREVPDA